MNLNESIRVLKRTGYRVTRRLDEMSRASNRTFGHHAENLFFILSDWKKTYDRSGKTPTIGQLKKFIEENDFEWSYVSNLLGLPERIGTGRSRIDLPELLDKLEEITGRDIESIVSEVEENKDIYDKYIDTFWQYYEKVHDGSDASAFMRTPEFKAFVDFWKNEPERAAEIFGRNYERAARYMDRIVNPDGPQALIAKFWDWHREKKAGHDAELDETTLEALAELVESPDAESYFSKPGYYMFIKKTVGRLLGRELGTADSEFDASSLDRDFTI